MVTAPADGYFPAQLPAAPQQLPGGPAPQPAQRGESGLPVPLAIGIAVVGLLASASLKPLATHVLDPHGSVDGRLRTALVLTLGFYVVLGLALGAFCVQRRVGLVWNRAHAVDSLVLGLPVGLAGGAIAVALNSALRGHLASDPNIEDLVGGGGALRITLAITVTAVLAPLVEETLFRGVLAGSLLARGPAPAVWLSAIAFAVWHMNPTSLRYYVFMGLILAALWRRRGLVASMAAHATFNGVLTVAAIAATTAGASFTQVGPVSFVLPGGWHAIEGHANLPGEAVYQGPAGAALVVIPRTASSGRPPTVEQVRAAMVRSEGLSHTQAIVPGSERIVTLGALQGVAAEVTVAGQPGHLLDLVLEQQTVELLEITAGSPAAERDWTSLLASLQAGTP